MRVLVAPDKFKGSLTAFQVCEAVELGIRDFDSTIEVITVPVADGGDGTARILTTLAGGRMIDTRARDPLCRQVAAAFGISGTGEEAYIEMAAASGLALMAPEERNPLITSSTGTGDLIANAMAYGVRTIVLGLGGSATNDAGTGMASALGVRFFDEFNQPIHSPCGKDLGRIARIDLSDVNPRLRKTTFIVLADVKNPLLGPEGCAAVFAPQKGADPITVALLERNMQRFHRLVLEHHAADLDFPGAGAAGGLGAGAKFFLNAALQSGADFILNAASLEEKVAAADLVITGEGKTDSQTRSGKVVGRVAALCLKSEKPLWIVAGRDDLSRQDREEMGITRSISLVRSGRSESDAIANASSILRDLVRKSLEEAYG